MTATAPLLELPHAPVQVPFEIHSMDWIDQNRRRQNELPHRHNYFVIIWFKKGRGTHLIDLDAIPLEEQTVYCITPGQVHLLTQEGSAEGYVISFTADFLGSAQGDFDLLFNTGLFYAFAEKPYLHLPPELQEELEEMAVKMMKEYANFYLLRAEILRGFLRIFLIYLTRGFERPAVTEAQSKGVDLVKRFLALVEKNYIGKRMVADYAAELAVTPNYLNEVVKKVSGFPASHHIQQRIILEAKRQATYSSASLKEIAYSLGFDDLAHFSKFFKNVSGQSFTDFRKTQTS
ncbi:MAG: helix-turn-helix domain-containing protein [Chitinophagaceae bacterium]|jgi:AraC-like DNA-binding protein|nr:helix-turn-helix domain-containing protein [Chitinophagaceae bacterium]